MTPLDPTPLQASAFGPSAYFSATWQRWLSRIPDLLNPLLAAIPTFQQYSPSVTGAGAMLLGNVTVAKAEYCVMGGLCEVRLDISFQTMGTGNPAVNITLPIPPVDQSLVLSGCVDDADTIQGFGCYTVNGFQVYNYAGTAWGIGPSRRIRMSGSYHIAGA